MASDSWDESKFDWKVATSSTRGVYGITYLLNVYNGHDSRHTDQSRIYVRFVPVIDLGRRRVGDNTSDFFFAIHALIVAE